MEQEASSYSYCNMLMHRTIKEQIVKDYHCQNDFDFDFLNDGEQGLLGQSNK